MTSSPHPLFDRNALRQNSARIAPHFKNYDFLHNFACTQITERLSVITRDFQTGVHIGAKTKALDLPLLTADLCADFSPNIVMDEEYIPFANGALDLIISTLNLHRTNDLPGALIQMKRALKPDGLFLAVLFGGESLRQLRDVLTQTEIKLHGGLSPRVFPFADKQDCGALLQRAGFALPVVDSETITVTYSNFKKMLRDLKGMGEQNILTERNRRYVGRHFFAEAEALYRKLYAEEDGQLPLTFEMIFLLGWAPHETQQQPLKPGSAKTRLADALNTDEIKTGETP